MAAIHGGNIETGTTPIARAVSHSAGQSYYYFRSAKEPGSGDLHLTSHLFDEPLVLCMASKHPHLLCVHGVLAEQGVGTWAIIGGAYEEGAEFLGKCLSCMIDIRDKTPSGKNYPGLRPENICNHDRAEQGIQLELSGDLRRELLNNIHLLDRFSRCIVTSLKSLAIKPNPEKRGE